MIIATGGTISARARHRQDWRDYETGFFTAADLVEQVPELAEVAGIATMDLANFSSADLTPAHWFRLRDLTYKYLEEEGYDGVVITHGTSTMEETAYFLHLTVPSRKPIVLVGAQRPIAALGSDAAINLLHGVKVAAAEESAGRGVMVVMDAAIHSAREVRKGDTYRLDAMESGAAGVLGHIDVDGTIQYRRSPERCHTVESEFADFQLIPPGTDHLPRVALLFSYPGGDGVLVDALVQAGYQGVVVAGMGAGIFSGAEEEALRKAAEQGLAVVRSSRTGGGRVVPVERYAGAPFLTGDNLSPQKARVLLILALAAGLERTRIQQAFHTY